MGSNKPQGHGIPKWMPSSFHRYLKDANKIETFLLLIVLYVDEFLITSSSVAGLRNINSALKKEFAMSDLGLLR